jgi:hypothetical protein
LIVDRELTTPDHHRWKARERAAHRQCAFTIALSGERGAYLRELNRLPDDHPIFIVPNAPTGPARRVESRYYRDLFDLPKERPVALHAGGMGWKPLEDLIAHAERWEETGAPVLVCQARLPSQMRSRIGQGGVRFAAATLPSSLLDYAVSSADVGLALYDSVKENDRLMGTASGKLCQYLKNGIPVITTDLPCFEWVEREQCGLRVRSVQDIRGAVERLRQTPDHYSANARRIFNAQLDFAVTFRPVAAFVEKLASCERASTLSAKAGITAAT